MMSKTLLEMTYNMLSSASMMRRFLVDAFSMACYLLNKFLVTAVQCRMLLIILLLDYLVAHLMYELVIVSSMKG